MTTTTKKPKVYDLVSNKPVARLYYQGKHHSHPVRRTLLVIEETQTHLTGYEFRCGNEVRTRSEAVSKVRTYRKDRIAKWGDYGRLTKSAKNFMKDPEESSLERFPITVMFTEGA